MIVFRSLPRLPCFQCVIPNCPVVKMSKWVMRGQCQGRLGRSASGARQRQESPLFQPISRQWQERQCRRLRLPFVRTLTLTRPRPAPLLRTLQPSVVHEIGGDGNCLFRCLSLVITGTESHHNSVRQRIVSHISENCKTFSALLPESPGNENEHAEACAHYLSTSKMADGSTWGSDVEILAAAHLLRTRIFVYTMHGPNWQWVEHGMELTEPDRKPYKDSIYLMHTGLVHYDLVEEVEPSHYEAREKKALQLPTTSSQINCKRSNEKDRRRRGYSVPCVPVAQQSGSRHCSNSRSSCHSTISSCSSSSSSIDSYLSCGDSVPRTNEHSASYKRRRRPGVASSNGNRRAFHRSNSIVYSNNNCYSKNVESAFRRTNLTPAANKNNHSRKNRLANSIQSVSSKTCAYLYKPVRPFCVENTCNKESHVTVPGIHKTHRYKPEKVSIAQGSTNTTSRVNICTGYKQKRETLHRSPGFN